MKRILKSVTPSDLKGRWSDKRERQGRARAKRTGHVVICACTTVLRGLREMD